MRNMSFMLTTEQFINQSKTVTRRNGWGFLKVGDLVMGCEKCQGLKKGEKIKKLGVIEILSTEFVPLNTITSDDCIKEGFPDMTPMQFVEFYCKHNKCEPDSLVNRIEFKHKINKPKFLTFKQWKIKNGLQEADMIVTCLRCKGTGMVECGCFGGECKKCESYHGEVPCPDCDEVGKVSSLIDLYEIQRRHDERIAKTLEELTSGNNNNR